VQKKNLLGQQELTITRAKTDPKQLVRDRIKIQLRNVLNAEKLRGTTRLPKQQVRTTKTRETLANKRNKQII